MKTRMFKKLGAGLLAILLLATISLPTAAASESKGDVVLQDFEAYNSYAEMKAAQKKGTDFYIHSGLYEIDVEDNGNHQLLIDVLGNWDIQLLNTKENQVKNDFSQCTAIAFYINIPAGCFNSDAVESGRPYLSLRYKERWDNEIMSSRLFALEKTDIYYYPVDGDPFIVTNMKEFYPFDQNAQISAQGFEGYIMVPFDANMLEVSESDFAEPIRASFFYQVELYGNAGFGTEIYVDDFTGVKDYANFAPYGKKATQKVQYVKKDAPTQAPTKTTGATAVTTTTASGGKATTTVAGATTTTIEGATTTTTVAEGTTTVGDTTTTANNDPVDTEPSGSLSWLWIAIAAVVLVGAGVVVFVVLKKKKGEEA